MQSKGTHIKIKLQKLVNIKSIILMGEKLL